MNDKEVPYPVRTMMSVKVKLVDAPEQMSRIQSAVAQRAYEIFQRRGAIPGHDLEDWQQAEAELLNRASYGLITLDHVIEIGTDISWFEPGTVELWVAPRRVTICGKLRTKNKRFFKAPNIPSGPVFDEIQLPAEIDSSRVETRLRGRSFFDLEIQLPKVHSLAAPKRAAAA
jgi:hypothetical protein